MLTISRFLQYASVTLCTFFAIFFTYASEASPMVKDFPPTKYILVVGAVLAAIMAIAILFHMRGQDLDE